MYVRQFYSYVEAILILTQVHLRKPCYDFLFLQTKRFAWFLRYMIPYPPDSSSCPTVQATGGVYKRQGRSQCGILTHAYGEFLVQVDITVFYPRQDIVFGITFVLVTLELMCYLDY